METLTQWLEAAPWKRRLEEVRREWEEATDPAGPGRFFDTDDLPAFDPDTREFSWGNAFWLSELSRWTYCPHGPERLRAIENIGLEVVDSIDEKGCHAVLFDPGERATSPCRLLAIRGTHTLVQWILDFDFGQTEWSSIDRECEDQARVHRGFKRVFDLLWDPLEDLLRRQTLPLVFTGHSLGAAMANFAASRMRPAKLYTMGCPRLGNPAFCRRLEGLTNYRIFHRHDVVPAWPAPTKGRSGEALHHAGVPCRLLPSGVLAFDEDPDAPPGDAFPGMMKREFQLGDDLGPPSPIADHAPIRYSRALAKGMRQERERKGHPAAGTKDAPTRANSTP